VAFSIYALHRHAGVWGDDAEVAGIYKYQSL